MDRWAKWPSKLGPPFLFFYFFCLFIFLYCFLFTLANKWIWLNVKIGTQILGNTLKRPTKFEVKKENYKYLFILKRLI